MTTKMSLNDTGFVWDIVSMETAANYFNAYATVPIIVFGLCGNIFTMYVFLRQFNWERGMMHYFFFLAISDTGCLLIYGSIEWVSEGLKFATNETFYYDLINHSAAACKTFRYTWNVFGSTSSWLIVCVTAERYITISSPLRKECFTGSLRKRIIFGTAIFWTLYHIPAAIVSYDVRPLYPGSDALLCTFQEPNRTGRLVFAYMKLIVMYAIPVLIVLVLNTLIVITLCRGRKQRQEILTGTTNIEARASRTLLIISTAFLVTIIPPSVTWLTYFHLFMVRTDPLTKYDQNLQEFIFSAGKFANTLSMVNYSINSIVYCYQFDFYKTALKRLFLCRFRHFRERLIINSKRRIRSISSQKSLSTEKLPSSVI